MILFKLQCFLVKMFFLISLYTDKTSVHDVLSDSLLQKPG